MLVLIELELREFLFANIYIKNIVSNISWLVSGNQTICHERLSLFPIEVWIRLLKMQGSSSKHVINYFFFLICLVGGGVQLGPLGAAATDWPIIACPGWLWLWKIWWNEDWQGKPRKTAQAPLCPPQIPLDQTRDWTRAAAVGSQWLTFKACKHGCDFSHISWLQRSQKKVLWNEELYLCLMLLFLLQCTSLYSLLVK
jgi:hypothetical protein